MQAKWQKEVDRIYSFDTVHPSARIGDRVVNRVFGTERCNGLRAGSLPGDLHKLWLHARPQGYHMEYGYSCMGYEIAGGLARKMAESPARDYVMVGDGSYLMMAQESPPSLQEGYKLNIVLLDNHLGFSSIGG